MNGTSAPTPGTALAVSGGGFRATLFHLGSLWRLNELGLLAKLKVITSVSGGSIASGYLGYRWKALQFDTAGKATNFTTMVVDPLREFCSGNYDIWASLAGALPFVSGGDIVASRYRKKLFGDATLQDLPDEGQAPRFIIYATSLQTGVSVRFSKTFLRDYKVGKIANPTVSLAEAVAASSAFPPMLSPVNIDTRRAQWIQEEGNVHFGNPKLMKTMALTDGGVYDNMGLEAIWDRYETVLISDAGAPFDLEPSPSSIWLKLAMRVIDIAGEQSRALRKRWMVQEFIAGRRKGSYWGIGTRINNYELGDALTRDNTRTACLAGVRTRLNKFSEAEQCQLINWGYALADAALRKHVLPGGPGPGKWPYPEHAL